MAGSITWWNRLEPRPRTGDLTGPLAAQIRDPLWLLTRQWQFGEFHGEDAGSPAWAELSTSIAPMVGWRVNGGPTQPLAVGMPLEEMVETEAFTGNLALQVELGQTFELLLGRRGGSLAALSAFRTVYPFAAATDEELAAETDREAARFRRLCGGRALDGVALYSAAVGARPGFPPPVPTLVGADRAAAEAACPDFVMWVQDVFGAIGLDEAAAWQSARLEYRAEVVAMRPVGSTTILTADPDREGSFEWYAFDERAVAPSVSALRGQVTTQRQSVLPMHVRFRGSPNLRWWDFESGQTDFGAIQADTRDLGRLIVADFMLVHGNDWFVVPFEQPVATLCRIDSLVVHDVFGGRTLVRRADAAPAAPGERWTMFSTTSATDPRGLAEYLVLPPTAVGVLQVSAPIEEARLLLDQMANMAWAVEHSTENGVGESWPGHERDVASLAAAQTAAQRPTRPAEEGPPIRYQIQTRVPENWIPLIPVAVDPLQGEIALKVGSMVRTTGGTPEPILPHGRLLKPGMLIEEQEVSRAGTRVTRVICRSRWTDGSTHIWIARRKTAGAGEGSSGLRFDLAVSTR